MLQVELLNITLDGSFYCRFVRLRGFTGYWNHSQQFCETFTDPEYETMKIRMSSESVIDASQISGDKNARRHDTEIDLLEIPRLRQVNTFKHKSSMGLKEDAYDEYACYVLSQPALCIEMSNHRRSENIEWKVTLSNSVLERPIMNASNRNLKSIVKAVSIAMAVKDLTTQSDTFIWIKHCL